MRPYLVPDAILDALSLIIFNPHKSLPRRHSDHANFTDEETGREVRWLPKMVERTQDRARTYAEAGRLLLWARPAQLSRDRRAGTYTLAVNNLQGGYAIWRQTRPAYYQEIWQDLYIMHLGTIRRFLSNEKVPEMCSEVSAAPRILSTTPLFWLFRTLALQGAWSKLVLDLHIWGSHQKFKASFEMCMSESHQNFPDLTTLVNPLAPLSAYLRNPFHWRLLKIWH